MPTEFDLDKLRLPSSMTTPIHAPKRLPRHREGERFLKGPISWPWLELAGRQSGKALHVALALWQEAGMARKSTVRFRLSRLTGMGIGHQAARRGLRKLADAGLVAIQQHPGQCLEVTLLDPINSSSIG